MQPSTGEIKLIIADDHELVRQGFIALLEKLDFVRAIAEARNHELDFFDSYNNPVNARG